MECGPAAIPPGIGDLFKVRSYRGWSLRSTPGYLCFDPSRDQGADYHLPSTIYHPPSTIHHLRSTIGAQSLKLSKQLNRLPRESVQGHGRLAAEALAEADRHGGLAETGLAGESN